jgi:hypothetical protein
VVAEVMLVMVVVILKGRVREEVVGMVMVTMVVIVKDR